MNEIVEIGQTQLSAADLIAHLQQYQLWPEFVKQFLTHQAIAPIECTPTELDAAREAYFTAKKVPADNRPTWLTQQGLTLDHINRQLSDRLRLQKFKHQTWGHQLESVFLKQKHHLDQVVYSLIRTKDAGTAQELYCRLLENEADFADLARQYSGGSEAKTGGRVGPVPLSVPHPNLARILALSEPGQLWPPNQLNNWYLIIRLDELKPARFDAATQAKLLDELFEQWLHEQMQQTPVRFLVAEQGAA